MHPATLSTRCNRRSTPSTPARGRGLYTVTHYPPFDFGDPQPLYVARTLAEAQAAKAAALAMCALMGWTGDVAIVGPDGCWLDGGG